MSVHVCSFIGATAYVLLQNLCDPYLWHPNQFLVLLHHPPPLKLADVFAYYALLKRFDERL